VALTVDPARRAERALAAAQTSLQAGEVDAVTRPPDYGRVRSAQRVPTRPCGPHPRPCCLHPRSRRRCSDVATEGRETARGGGAQRSRARPISPHGEPPTWPDKEAWRWRSATPSEPSPSLPVSTCPRHAARRVVLLTIDGRAVATPKLQQAAKVLAEIPAEDVIRWGAAAAATAASWDVEGWRALNERHVQLVRDAGALAQLPLRLVSLGIATAWLETSRALPRHRRERKRRRRDREPNRSVRSAEATGPSRERSRDLVDDCGRVRTSSGRTARHARDPCALAAAVLYNGLARYDLAHRQPAGHSNTFEPWSPCGDCPS
jgi:hypothetical protein